MRILYIILSLYLTGCASVDFSIKINHDKSINTDIAKNIVLTYFLNQSSYRYNRSAVNLIEHHRSEGDKTECKNHAITYSLPVKSCSAKYVIQHKESDPHCTPHYVDVLEVCNETDCEYEYIEGIVICE